MQYLLYMGSDILLSNIFRVPMKTYTDWALHNVTDIPGDVDQTEWSYQPVAPTYKEPNRVGWVSVALFACSRTGCSKACPVTFNIAP